MNDTLRFALSCVPGLLGLLFAFVAMFIVVCVVCAGVYQFIGASLDQSAAMARCQIEHSFDTCHKALN